MPIGILLIYSISMKLKLLVILLTLFYSCTSIKCYETPFDYNGCMETAYATIINATGRNTKPELYMSSVISIYLGCQKKKKEWHDQCPYLIFM